MQQHIAARFQMIGPGVFDFIVADAVFAGDEDHACRCQPGGVDRVVACAWDDVHVAVAEFGGGASDCVHAFRMEGAGRVIRDFFRVNFQTGFFADFVGEGENFFVHVVEQFVIDIAQVDAEFNFAGDHVATAGEDLHHAYRAAPKRRIAVADISTYRELIEKINGFKSEDELFTKE